MRTITCTCGTILDKDYSSAPIVGGARGNIATPNTIFYSFKCPECGLLYLEEQTKVTLQPISDQLSK